MFTTQFLKDTGERLLWTFLQAFVGALTVPALVGGDLSGLQVAAVAGVAALLSAVKSILLAVNPHITDNTPAHSL